MLPPPLTLPELPPSRRLYIAVGQPWRQALQTFYSEAGNERRWSIDMSYRQGDMILTIFNTDPRTFLCVEWARRAGRPNGDILVDWDRTIVFEYGLSVEAVQAEFGKELRAKQSFDSDDANWLIRALNMELVNRRPWFAIPGSPP